MSHVGHTNPAGTGRLNSMKLHLGCGRRHIDGYVHIDVVDYPHVDHVSERRQPAVPAGSLG